MELAVLLFRKIVSALLEGNNMESQIWCTRRQLFSLNVSCYSCQMVYTKKCLCLDPDSIILWMNSCHSQSLFLKLEPQFQTFMSFVSNETLNMCVGLSVFCLAPSLELDMTYYTSHDVVSITVPNTDQGGGISQKTPRLCIRFKQFKFGGTRRRANRSQFIILGLSVVE